MKVYKVNIYFPKTNGYSSKYFSTNDKKVITNFLAREVYKGIEFRVENIRCAAKEFYILDESLYG